MRYAMDGNLNVEIKSIQYVLPKSPIYLIFIAIANTYMQNAKLANRSSIVYSNGYPPLHHSINDICDVIYVNEYRLQVNLTSYEY